MPASKSKFLNVIDVLKDFIDSIKFSTISGVHLKECLLLIYLVVIVVAILKSNLERIPKHTLEL